MQQSKNPQPDDVGLKPKSKVKRERTFVLECRWYKSWSKEWTKWTKWRAYHTDAERQTAKENLERKYNGSNHMRFEFRDRPDGGANE